jgi:YD repeat-containing protein
LPSKTEVYGLETTGLNLVSKMTYGYDEENFAQESNQIITPIQHDTANFGASLIAGRGNSTSVTRWNTDFPTSASEAVTSRIRYDIAGSPVAALDPLNRKVKTDYADSFNDTTVSRNTFAYPTTLTDPANNSSTVKYRYDTGANVWAKSPAPAGNTSGKETTREYDTIGRLSKETIVNSGAYTRYEYPANQIQSKVYSTIIDTNNNGADQSDEVMSESWTDGAGRTLRARTEHPGSTGGYSGSLAEYDILGQVKRSTVPTEINSNYEPAGDDQIRGWLWTSAEYDWKGRVTREINTDGTDRLMNYDGCGCAGGQVTTIQSESVPNQANTTARRTQKSYQDILGRTYKTEVLNWDNSVYSTVKNTFNGRDQAIEVKQYQGTDTSATFQTTTATFDGHGRLKTQHRPEQQNSNGTPAYTNYNYNINDSISSITDARGATTNYVYNDSRGLLTNINYGVPANSNIPVTPGVSFTYDNIGNRTSMTDGVGNMSYEYNQLSQMTAETRQFSDYLTDPTVPANGFRLEYNYTLGGQLKSYKDPYNRQFDFSFDKSGRNTSVNGTVYSGVTNYSSNLQYRAFGTVKQINYGNQTTATMTYNNRLQPNSYRLMDGTQTLFGKDYSYTTGTNNDNDGLLKKSVHYDDTQSVNERAKRNQVNKYDAQGRIVKSETGEDGLTPFGANNKNGPFQQSYSYNAFGNLTGKNDRDFGNNIVGCTGCPRDIVSTETIVNNRTQSSYYSAHYSGQTINDYQYDADGRMLLRNGITVQYDAVGRRVFINATGTNLDDSYGFDGNGDLTKWQQYGDGSQFLYYVKSSVFKADVLELDSTGAMKKEYVFSPNRAKVAYFKDNEVIWMHSEPSGKESYEFKQDRTANLKQTYDPTGATATSNGYNGGGSCPPNTCWSQANTSVTAMMNMGYRGLETLMARRQEQLFQDSMFWLVSAGVFVDPNNRLGSAQLSDDNLRYRLSANGNGSHNFFSGSSGSYFGYSNLDSYVSGFTDAKVSGISEDKYFRSALEDFLSNNPNCLEIIRAISRVNGDGEFNDFMAGVFIIDTSKNPELLNKTLGQLGATTVPENVKSTKLGDAFTQKIKVGENDVILPIGVAATVWDTGVIYVSSNISTSNVGLKIFHEMLHAYFKGNHIDIAKQLNLPLSKGSTNPFDTSPNSTNQKLMDTDASLNLDKWLASGCK